MSRKPRRGYYVRGQFVAEGSELDLELKRELRGGDAPSRTELKRESDAAQALGEALLGLSANALNTLKLPDKLMDAVADAKRITDFEGLRRQMQFIGKLMRQLDEPERDAIRRAVDEQHVGSAAQTARLHEAERWREALVAHDEDLSRWLTQHPNTDAQQLRALIRQARKDAVPAKAGLTPRHGKAWREIFQLVRASLDEANAHESAQSSSNPNATPPAA